LTSGAGKRHILKVDIRKAYDTVSHEWLKKNIPINKHVLSEWLNAEIMENGKAGAIKPTEGVPQGGPISPTLFNMVLNGVEEAIMEGDGANAKLVRAFPIRYADDLLIAARTQSDLEKTKETLVEFLKPRGLEISEEKSTHATLEEGFDFLGFNIREYRDSRPKNPKLKGKLGTVLTKPGRKSIENFKAKVRKVLTLNKKVSAAQVIRLLNPIIRGYANYYRFGSG